MTQPTNVEQIPNDFSRRSPASEHELTVDERKEPHKFPRARVLGRLQFQMNGRATAVPKDMVASGDFRGLSVVGSVASLSYPDGLFAQCCWFHQDIDWFWVRITDIVKIELRKDLRFRGGTTCLWLTSKAAEYALATGHVDSYDEWEETLELYNAPRCDEWPRMGLRPGWWPDQWAGAWPHDRSPREYFSRPLVDNSLASLAEHLSLTGDTNASGWRRLGPWGDDVGGSRRHHLSQTTPWSLVPDAGMKGSKLNETGLGEEETAGAGDAQRQGKRKRDKARPPMEKPSGQAKKRQR